jgi:hypothetical protein
MYQILGSLEWGSDDQNIRKEATRVLKVMGDVTISKEDTARIDRILQRETSEEIRNVLLQLRRLQVRDAGDVVK